MSKGAWHSLIWRYVLGLPLNLMMIALIQIAAPKAFGQSVEDVEVSRTESGYDIEVRFSSAVRYLNHLPQKQSREYEIFLDPSGFAEIAAHETRNSPYPLVWNSVEDVPLAEILMDGEFHPGPSLVFRLTRPLPVSVRSSADLKSVVLSIAIQNGYTQQQSIASVAGFSALELERELNLFDVRLARVLQRANQEFVAGNYPMAVRLYTKIRDESSDKYRQFAQEMLGVSRLMNHQDAQAKAEFNRYLSEYPSGEGAIRVRQRLDALVTSNELPKPRLRKPKKPAVADSDAWQSQFYGGVSQTYYRHNAALNGDNSILLRSDLSTDLDFSATAIKKEVEFKTQMIASYRQDFLHDDKDKQFIPNRFWLSAENTAWGLKTTLGRQSHRSIGTFGRFDGAVVRYQFDDKIQFTGAYGHPVDLTEKSQINSEVTFYGLSAQSQSIWEGWDLAAYLIEQQNHGLVDRRALGTEVRYADDTKSLFSLVDYDVLFNEVNQWMLLGHWNVSEGTGVNLQLDYRFSPLLTTANAMIGQQVETINQLLLNYSIDEIQQLARDRTARSRTISMGVSQQLGRDWQLNGDINYYQYGATRTSGGVEGFAQMDADISYAMQLIGNKVFFESDTLSMGLRFTDSSRYDSYSLNLSWRVKIQQSLQFNPRIRLDYRKNAETNDERWIVRPYLRMDYRVNRSIRVNFDLGYEWQEQSFKDQTFENKGLFGSLHYRIQF